MLKENEGTQNEGIRDTKANVEAVDKTRIEDKRKTKTKGEESRTHRTALCVGLICPGSVWNSLVYEGGVDHRIIGDDGGAQIGTRSEVQRRSGWEPNVEAQNPKCKHHTEDEGCTVELPWDILELRPGDW